jgi:3-hydroxyisobutyrate dehydrogenase-like beta-hydroxyacid dehydrogenase
MKIFADFKLNPRDDARWRMRVQSAGDQGHKDLALAEELAGQSGIDTPIAAFVRSRVQEIIGQISSGPG